jgi:hypothetical protein
VDWKIQGGSHHVLRPVSNWDIARRISMTEEQVRPKVCGKRQVMITKRNEEPRTP